MSCLPCMSPRKRDVSRIEDDNGTTGPSSSFHSIDDSFGLFLCWFPEMKYFGYFVAIWLSFPCILTLDAWICRDYKGKGFF